MDSRTAIVTGTTRIIHEADAGFKVVEEPVNLRAGILAPGESEPSSWFHIPALPKPDPIGMLIAWINAGLKAIKAGNGFGPLLPIVPPMESRVVYKNGEPIDQSPMD